MVSRRYVPPEVLREKRLRATPDTPGPRCAYCGTWGREPDSTLCWRCSDTPRALIPSYHAARGAGATETEGAAAQLRNWAQAVGDSETPAAELAHVAAGMVVLADLLRGGE